MNTLKDKTAIAGVGATPYYRRGESLPQSPMEMAGKAVIAALGDAGLTVDDLDGFALYSMGFDTSLFAQWLGVPDVKFTAQLTGGGGGAAGSIGLASAAIVSGMADVVVSVMTLQQAGNRFGASFAPCRQRDDDRGEVNPPLRLPIVFVSPHSSVSVSRMRQAPAGSCPSTARSSS
jgi:hypothetical protein